LQSFAAIEGRIETVEATSSSETLLIFYWRKFRQTFGRWSDSIHLYTSKNKTVVGTVFGLFW